MSRIINTESGGKDRRHLTRAVVLALRELMRQTDTGTTTCDLAAFIVLALEQIAGSIDPSVLAWEKRGYWLKADRFRLEWAWAGRLGGAMRTALLANDWAGVARSAAQVAEKLNGIQLPQRHRLGTPWVGAYAKLTA